MTGPVIRSNFYWNLYTTMPLNGSAVSHSKSGALVSNEPANEKYGGTYSRPLS